MENEEIVAFIEQLQSWHEGKVANLRDVIKSIDSLPTLVINGDKIKLTKQTALFLKLGLQTALSEFEVLPFTMKFNTETQNEQ